MKFQHLGIALSLSVLACASDEPTSSSTLGTLGGSASVGDAGSGSGSLGGSIPTGGSTSTGGTGSSSSGASLGGNTVTGPAGGSDVCEVKTVDSGRVTPDMLIVLDRSGSMKMGNVNRWDPSVSAIKMLTSSLGGTINFGLLTYPGKGMAAAPAQDCSTITDFVQQIACIAAGGVAAIDTCIPGAVDVPIASNAGPAISTALDSMSPGGATPTASSLQAAHKALGSAVASVDETVRPKYVLLVTDGAPNCSNPNSTGGRGFDNSAVDQSVAEIQAMAKDGIKTYVIGYNTKSDAQLSAALDKMAQAGNTGDQQHHAIEDGAGLQAEFQKIAGAAASCEYALNNPPADPSYVEVKLDGKQINLNDPNGWQISPDRRVITLVGSACSAISGQQQHMLSVRVLCNRVVLQ